MLIVPFRITLNRLFWPKTIFQRSKPSPGDTGSVFEFNCGKFIVFHPNASSKISAKIVNLSPCCNGTAVNNPIGDDAIDL